MNTEEIKIIARYIKPRLTSGLALGIIFIICACVSSYIFMLLITFITVLAFKEWTDMTRGTSDEKYFYILILPSFVTLSVIKFAFPEPKFILLYFIHIWSVDVFAMIFGKMIQGPKLAKISPNKTISGFVLGILSAALISTLLNAFTLVLPFNIFDTLCYWIILGAVAQASDLLLSYFKRKFNLKDFSQLIPGHGGVLDRFDSCILTSYIYLATLLIAH